MSGELSSISAGKSLSIQEVLDQGPVGAATYALLAIALLCLICEGYDLGVTGVATPELAKAWHIEPSALTPVQAAGPLGLLLGAPMFGAAGDRFGRKTIILVTLGVIGVFTLLAAASANVMTLTILRFLAGLGMGGLVPNVNALALEAAPERRRGLFVMAVNFGFPFGIALSNLIGVVVVPGFGWQGLFVAGGVVPLISIALAWHFAGESVFFLAGKNERADELRLRLKQLRPNKDFPDGVYLVAPEAFKPRPGVLKPLFAGRRRFITVSLWIIYSGDLFGNFFIIGWLPALLRADGATMSQAGLAAAVFPIGGFFGGVLLILLVDRFGALPVAILLMLGVPLFLAIGLSGAFSVLLLFAVGAAGFSVGGANPAIAAVVGMLYPAPMRSLGTGWAQAAGRVGAIAAQVVGGLLLSRRVPVNQTFIIPAVVVGVAAAASLGLTARTHRLFGTLRLREITNEESGAAKASR